MSHHAEIPPGPNAGRVWRDPPESRRDPLTRRTVVRLTNYRGHSHHLIGPAPCWLDGGRCLLVVSDREGQGNLFSHHFATGALTQLTDFRGGHRPALARLSPTARQLGFWYGKLYYELELDSLCMRVVEPPPDRGLRSTPGRVAALRVGKTAPVSGEPILWLADGPAVASRRALALIGGPGETSVTVAGLCLDPEGKRVVFGAAHGGYAQIFSVVIGRFDALPTLASVVAGRRR